MGMKGGDGASGETPSEIDSIRSQLEKVEILLQEQTRESQELKAQVAESKSLMKSEIKDQLDDFLTKFMRL
jgi:septal ring factor EnvC (AmiA/AmiB activator)